MKKHTRVSLPLFRLPPAEIDGFDSIAELALDMHWSWNSGGLGNVAGDRINATSDLGVPAVGGGWRLLDAQGGWSL